MNPEMPAHLAGNYKSHSQQARVVTESWAEHNLFCPCCRSPRLRPLRANTKAVDLACPECRAPFQLKAQSKPYARRVIDSAYGPMVEAVKSGATPNLLLLHYDPTRWEALDLLLVPRFALSLSCIEKRRPLGPKARRRGWVGCNILLTNIPPDARIPLLVDGVPERPSRVRNLYARLTPLQRERYDTRGWMLDVLRLVRDLNLETFSLKDAYRLENELQRLHPRNHNIRPKIRQQLQQLRDLQVLDFLGSGNYRLRQLESGLSPRAPSI